MLYRIINPTLVEQFRGHITEDGTTYTNADAEAKALESGEWHPLTIQPAPQIQEGQVLTKNYTLVDDTIILNWVVTTPTSGLDANLE